MIIEERDIQEVILSRNDSNINELAILIPKAGICKIQFDDNIKREHLSELLITLAGQVANWNPEK